MLPPSSISPVPIYTPGWIEAEWSRVPCLRKQHDGRGLNSRSPDPLSEVLTAWPQTLPYFLNTCHDFSFKFGHFSFQNVKSSALIKTAELERILTLLLASIVLISAKVICTYSTKQNINQSNKFRSAKLTRARNFFFFSICRYQIMLECWDEDPNNRPTFERLHETITEFLKEEVNIFILPFLTIYLAIILPSGLVNLAFSRETVFFSIASIRLLIKRWSLIRPLNQTHGY